jgi:hypothetical protein
MASLKVHQLDLLRYIIDQRGPVSVAKLDRRSLRPLKSHDLVVEHHGYVTPTASAHRLVAGAPATSLGNTTPREGLSLLSEQQEETLRYLLRQTAPVPAAHLDGRVLRALRARGLVDESKEWITPSAAGRLYFEKHVQRERRLREQRERRGGGSARAEALLRAVDLLENAIPLNVELQIGDMPAYADDVLAGLRRFAREMGSRNSVTRSQ